ncbi:MAG: YceI family protein [Granulosicoccus sp.]
MYIRKILSASLLAASFLVANVASAELTLDSERSSLSIISYKVLAGASASIAERHTFSGLTGSVSDAGAASVSIPLDSIETNIPIRNERLAKFVFETDQYPNATVTASVPENAMAAGTSMMNLDITLSLHGKEQTMSVPVLVSNENGEVTVSATQPLMLDAVAYDFGSGIAKLAELAKLLHIPTTVPVSFSLVFTSGS